MKTHYEIKRFNAGLVMTLYILLTIYSCANAQSLQRVDQTGYEVSFGAHNFQPRAEGRRSLTAGSTGISVGAFIGNNLLKLRARGLGYYEARRILGQKFYQYEGELLANIYPLEFVRTHSNIIDLYLVTGINYTYLDFDNNARSYPSKSFSRVSQSVGIGIEYILRMSAKNISLFTELTTGNNLNPFDERSKETSPLPPMLSAVNFGMRIAYRRAVKRQLSF